MRSGSVASERIDEFKRSKGLDHRHSFDSPIPWPQASQFSFGLSYLFYKEWGKSLLLSKLSFSSLIQELKKKKLSIMHEHENYLQVTKSCLYIKWYQFNFVLGGRISPNRWDLQKEILVQPKGYFFNHYINEVRKDL